MGYKWRPSKSARREFANNMKDADFASDYYARKEAKAEKRRSASKFDYSSAGGNYTATKIQYDEAFRLLGEELTDEQKDACNQIIYSYSCNEKIHHDFIHVVNELIRKKARV